MEITKLSTKGQVVIPEKLRQGMHAGTAFSITRQQDLIVLKRIDGLTKEEEEELRELDRIWKEIDAGDCSIYSEKEFFEKLKEW